MISKLIIRSSGAKEGFRAGDWVTPGMVKIALWVLLIGWTAWIAGQWAREALAQRAPANAAPSRPAPDLDTAVAQAAAVPLFGEAAQSGAVQTPPANLNIKLRGVFAGGGPQAAIVNTGREDEFVPLGKEVSPGAVLQGVYPTHIVISRNGVAEHIELEALKSETSGSTAKTAAATRSSHEQSTVSSASAADTRLAAPPPVPTPEAVSVANPVSAAEVAVPAAPDAPSSPLFPQPTPQSHAPSDALLEIRLPRAESILAQG